MPGLVSSKRRLTVPRGKRSKIIRYIGTGVVTHYHDEVKTLFGANIVAYWPMDEAAGAASEDISGHNYDGVYTAVTLGEAGIGDGGTSAKFDGATSMNYVYSAGLAAAFNGAEGSAMLWAKIINAAEWLAADWRCFFRYFADDDNLAYIYKFNAGVIAQYRAGAVSEFPTAAINPTAWFHIGITWSAANDRVRLYVNGAQEGADATVLGVWAGAPAINKMVIGSSEGAAAFQVWSGWLAHAIILNREATAAEMLTVATV